VGATASIKWSPDLLRMLFDELYVTEMLEDMLGTTVDKLHKRQYAQAITMALILRHSWLSDDIAWMRDQLGLSHVRWSEPRRHRLSR
jgi:hypothetical protein